MKNSKKVAIVTGSTRGIGEAIALELAKKNIIVVVNYASSAKKADKLVMQIKNIGSDAIAIKADVSDARDVKKMINKTIKKFGQIDILVNNAGIQKAASFEKTTEQMWDETVNVNLKGMFHCIQAVLPYMKQQKKGRIVNISSIAGFVGSLASVPYGTSKAGVVNMTKTLSKELGKYNITVNSVAPGPTETELLKKLDRKLIDMMISQTPLNRVAKPEDIAKAVHFFISPEADFITGQTLVVDGGRI